VYLRLRRGRTDQAARSIVSYYVVVSRPRNSDSHVTLPLARRSLGGLPRCARPRYAWSVGPRSDSLHHSAVHAAVSLLRPARGAAAPAAHDPSRVAAAGVVNDCGRTHPRAALGLTGGLLGEQLRSECPLGSGVRV